MFDMFFVTCWAANGHNVGGQGSAPWFGHSIECRDLPEKFFVGAGHFLSSCWSDVAYKHRAEW